MSCQPQYLGTDDAGRPIIRFAELECDFVRPTDPDFKPLSGRTEKFLYLARDEAGRARAVKIKYKSEEVFAEVAATRLLWSFGFAVDTMQPLAVVCKGCAEDPFAMLSAKVPEWPAREALAFLNAFL